MSNTNIIGDDCIHTEDEYNQIAKIQQTLYILQGNSRVQPNVFSFFRYLGFAHKITVYNISGKQAWIILSPAPICGVSSFGLDKVGQISFTTNGNYKCQQSPLMASTAREFDLDNNQIYYSVFFNCDGKWKVHFKDRKMNSTKYDINLLQRHVIESVDYDFVPIN